MPHLDIHNLILILVFVENENALIRKHHNRNQRE